jgi:uracil-DNA glycosylase family 4
MTTERNWVNLPFERADMRGQVEICDTCPLACSMPGQITFVPFEIVGNNNKPDVLFVAEAPFKDEMAQQRPLISRSGSFLRDVLDQYLDSYALAHVVSCHPTNTKKLGVHTPTEEEQAHCVEHVREFIDQIQPKLIVLLGKIAYTNLLPEHYIEAVGKDAEYVGKMQKKGVITSQGITYACSYHPSYIVRNGGVKSNSYVTFNSRIKRALQVLGSGIDIHSNVPEDDLDIKFVSMEKIPVVLRELEPYNDIGLDYEARTLDPWFIENKPTGFSLSVMTGPVSGISYYIVIDREFTDHERQILVDFFKRKSPWTYNAKYEANMTWASLGKRIKFNDTFSLCKIDCSPTSLKLNAQKYLGADLWEEEVHSIVAYYEFIFGQMTKQATAYPEIVDLLKAGKKAEACELIQADEKILKKFAKLLSSCDSLSENITEKDFAWGLTKYPYAWAAVPTEILGTYCCWDSYLTLKLKRHLWEKYDKYYQYYITQTWLAGNMEAYGYNWNDSKAVEHNVYYIEEAIHCLHELIKMIDLSDEDIMTADSIVNDPDPEITPKKRLLNLKSVFNPLSNLTEKQDNFWRAYRTPFTETIAFLKYLHLEVGQNDVLDDDTFLSLIKADVDPDQIILAMIEACGTSRRKRTALDKILDGLEGNLNFHFRRFANEITIFHYEAHTEFGGVKIDDKTTWNKPFEMLYYLKRFKKVLKVDSTYVWGKVGRESVWLAEMDDRRNPPRRIKNYYDVPDDYILKPNERWILNADFFECGADTKRWRAGIHTVPSSSELREIYEPRTPTSIMLHADYAQNEVRFLAKMAEEKNLMAAFEAGVDVHRFVASNIFKKPESEITGTERSYAKAATFGLLYGKTVSSFAQEMMGGDLAGATKFFDEFFSAFPGIKRFVDSQHAQVLEHGFVYTLFGDPININTDFYREDEVLRRAQNYPIQSSASSLGAHAIYLLNEAVAKHNIRAAPLGFCHDACDWDIEIADLFKFLPLMHETMVGYIKKRFGIPVGIDWELGIHQNFMMKLEPEDDGSYKFECPKDTLPAIVDRMETHFDVTYEVEKEDTKFHSMKDLFAPKGAFSKFFGTDIVTCEGKMHFLEKVA